MRSSLAIVLVAWLLFVALLASVHVWATPVLTAEPDGPSSGAAVPPLRR